MDRQTKLDVLQKNKKNKRNPILYLIEVNIFLSSVISSFGWLSFKYWVIFAVIMYFIVEYDLSHNVDTDGIS